MLGYADTYEDSMKSDRDVFLIRLRAALYNRRFFISEDGEMGMAPFSAGEGDPIVVALGSDVPLLLRAREGGGWKYVGDAYVDGYMYGKAIRQLDEGKRDLQSFVID